MKTFKQFKSQETLSEGLLGGLLSGIASFIIKGILKISKLKAGLFGTEEVEGGIGLRYFLQDGKMIRFNHSGKSIKSIDVWNDDSQDWDTPSLSFNLESLKDVLGFIPVFASLMKKPKVDLKDLDDAESLGESFLLEGRPRGSKNKVKETAQKIKAAAGRGRRKQSIDIQAREAEAAHGKDLEKFSDPETVFDDLRFGTEMVADGIQNSLLVTGTGGIGKTETVIRTLDSKGKVEGVDYQLIKGTVTAAGMYSLFAKYPDQIIVFDDADSAFRSQDAKNLLKAALDTKPVRRLNYTIKKSFNPDDYERDSEEWEEKIEKGFVPSKVDFTGRVIFISNLDPEKMDQAVRSRAIVVDIKLTEEGIVDLIEKIAPEISFHGVPVTPKHVSEALKLMRANLDTLKEITIRAFVLIAKSMYAADKAKVSKAQKNRLIKMATGGLLG